MTELHDLTVVGAARAIREREVSAEELMSALLARCSELEPQLRVWVTLDAGRGPRRGASARP